MCGIAGFVRAQGPLPSADLIERMKSAMVHRGPDAHGTFVNENVALGHQRLKIIDLSSAADQPFRSEDGRYIMVFNGEIYNYRQIKEELGVTRYRSESDTEVLLLAFMKWGRSCLERLNGMFSFAIWDEQEQELFVARDRLGIKPLYYYHGDEGFVFASEMRALLASGIVPRRIDDGALAEYLAFHTVHAPRTIVRNVQMLEPGHFLTLRKGELMDTCYWDLATNRLQIDDSYDNVKAQIRRRLLASVERRLIADVPIGAFLSGGIDSSALVALISEVRETPIHTFSVVFDEEEFSEKQYADRVAGRFNTKHHTLPLKAGDLLDNLPRILLETDHPSVDGPNTHVISEATKKAGITVAISGLGGDELFAGYPVFRQLPALLNNPVLGKIPLSLRKGVSGVLGGLAGSAKARKALALFGEEKSFAALYPLFRRVRGDSEIHRLLIKERSSEVPGLFDDNMLDELLSSKHVLSAISIAEVSTYMQNVLLRDSDQMSMAHALEIRVPFLDHEVVEYALGVGDSMKYPATPKKLLVESLGDALPPEIVNRKKMGFTFPWESWLKRDLQELCESHIQFLAGSELFDADAVLQDWASFRQGDSSVHWTQIWSLVVLSSWMQVNEVV